MVLGHWMPATEMPKKQPVDFGQLLSSLTECCWMRASMLLVMEAGAHPDHDSVERGPVLELRGKQRLLA